MDLSPEVELNVIFALMVIAMAAHAFLLMAALFVAQGFIRASGVLEELRSDRIPVRGLTAREIFAMKTPAVFMWDLKVALWFLVRWDKLRRIKADSGNPRDDRFALVYDGEERSRA